uniref:Reverse transcriptase N-terminal domain-containing protein n=1 Tax=Vertebrata australis TaxID=1967852 RepID=A0A1Z1MIA4_9FLOR|nr:hypothetical protein [Vertebrata australis]ARW65773.1 hypothetical protein [Vertebrata australis]
MYISLVKDRSTKYLLDIKTSWKTFCWSKIYLRILMLVKQIFIETKKHNLNKIYRLQNYLINSNELKIFELNKIISKIYFFYYKVEKKKCIVTSQIKLNLINNIFNINIIKSEDYVLIKKQLKENLIFACIKPVYQARSTKFISKYENLNFLDHLINKHKKYYYSSNRFITKKLTQYTYINKLIVNFLYQSSYLNINEIFYSNRQLYLFDTIKNTNFIDLINQITFIDLVWYNFNQLKNEESLKTISNVNLNNLPISFITYLKFLFSIKKSRIFSYIFLKTNNNRLFRKLIHSSQNWYYAICSLVSINLINTCNLCINQILHLRIQKKKASKDSIHKAMYKMNTMLNRFIYLCNVNKYYINYSN